MMTEYDDDDDDGVIDVSVTSRNHGDRGDDVRDHHWRQSTRHNEGTDSGIQCVYSAFQNGYFTFF